MLTLDGSYTFNAPRAVVWEMLQDPEVLRTALPGCEKLEAVGSDEYEGAISIRIGPVQGNFRGKVSLSELNPPHSYHMLVHGQGAAGFMKGEGNVTLDDAGDQTLFRYSGTAEVGGKVASVGQRLLETSARSIVSQALETIGEQASARAMGGEGMASAASRTQADVAGQVARDILAETVPHERRPFVIGGAIGLLLIIIAAIYFTIIGG